MLKFIEFLEANSILSAGPLHQANSTHDHWDDNDIAEGDILGNMRRFIIKGDLDGFIKYYDEISLSHDPSVRHEWNRIEPMMASLFHGKDGIPAFHALIAHLQKRKAMVSRSINNITQSRFAPNPELDARYDAEAEGEGTASKLHRLHRSPFQPKS